MAASFLDPTLFGQATSDGTYDEVRTYDQTGNSTTRLAGSDPSFRLSWLMVVGSLVALWVLGASVFKGSNRS